MPSLFFDLDDILAEEHLIKTRLISPIPWHGRLYTPDPIDHQLPSGHICELPLWLAHPLFLQEFAEISRPKCFSSKIQDRLQMSPVSVSLYDASPYFLSLAKKIMFIWMDESLYSLILFSIMHRCAELVRLAVNQQQVLFRSTPRSSLAPLDAHPIYPRLEASERALLKIQCE